MFALICLFVTLGVGFWLGRLRFGSFSLGPVAATLIVGVAVGQLNVENPDMVKTIFFLLFLFSVGYGIGPQLLRAFRGDGWRIVGFATVAALVSATLVVVSARILGYTQGVSAGLYAGSLNTSAALGLLSDTV